MLALLKTPSLRRFFLASLQSELGNGAAYVALLLVAYQRSHSGWAIALVLLADFLPGIALGAPLGALADRLPRRRLMVSADLLRSVAFVALAVVPSLPAMVALALVAGVGTTMFRTATNAALPGMVSAEQRSAATALYHLNFDIGLTVGPALTALVFLFAAPTLVLAANGATFLVSAVVLSSLQIDSGTRSAQESRPEEERSSLWASTVDGARATRRISGLPLLLLIGAVAILAGGLMNVAEPLLATGPLHAGKSGYSLLVAVYGAAMAAGSLANARAGSRVEHLRRWLMAGLAVQGAGMIGSALAPSFGWAALTFALTGAGNSLFGGPEVRLLQEMVSDRLRGRVFGLRDMLINLAFVIAFLSAGLVLSAFGVRAVFAFGGVALLALSGAACLRFRPARGGEVLHAVPEAA